MKLLIDHNEVDKMGEGLILNILSFSQKYVVLATIIVILICMIFRYLAKIRKNTRVMNYFLTLAIGMGILCVIFTFLPYIVLNNME